MTIPTLDQSRISLVWRWDIGTLTYVPWDGSLTAGGAVTIGTVNQGTAGTSPWLVADQGYTRLVDPVGGTNPIYIGKAAAGTATSAASWAIIKLTFDANDIPTAIKYAGGSTAFTNIWDNRAALSYS